MIILLLKGAVIGVANIIPGVSGGTMAVSMGIYDKLIHAITNIKKEFKESVAFLAPIGVGAVLGVGVLSFVITYLFENFSLQTNVFFIGLILGGIPLITKRIDKDALKVTHYIVGVIAFLLVVFLATSNETVDTGATISLNLINFVVLFFVGIIASATMVIPGVSGSMVLMILGFYHPILAAVKSFIVALTELDIAALMHQGFILLPMGIGVILGIGVISKIIDYMLKRLPNYAYSVIMGLIVASPFAIVLMNAFNDLSIVTLITGIITGVLGYFIALKLS